MKGKERRQTTEEVTKKGTMSPKKDARGGEGKKAIPQGRGRNTQNPREPLWLWMDGWVGSVEALTSERRQGEMSSMSENRGTV